MRERHTSRQLTADQTDAFLSHIAEAENCRLFVQCTHSSARRKNIAKERTPRRHFFVTSLVVRKICQIRQIRRFYMIAYTCRVSRRPNVVKYTAERIKTRILNVCVVNQRQRHPAANSSTEKSQNIFANRVKMLMKLHYSRNPCCLDNIYCVSYVAADQNKLFALFLAADNKSFVACKQRM